MNKEKIINSILQKDFFKEFPIVLMDVGASGGIHHQWEMIAPYSICLAFDPDKREMHNVVEDSRFKELYIIGAALHPLDKDHVPFYLTRSPFCSSLLEPDSESLKSWSFSDLFEMDRLSSLPSITPSKALKEHNIKYVDWYKSDSQGMDLSIFKAFSKSVRDNIIAVEFEPGILDAYCNEDKLYKIIEYMNDRPYWMESLTVNGPERLNKELYKELVGEEGIQGFEYGSSPLPLSPGWAEVRYFKNFQTTKEQQSERDLLLAIVFAFIRSQYGYALELANQLVQDFDGLFNRSLLDSICKHLRLIGKSQFKQNKGREFRNNLLRKLRLRS